MAAAAALAVAAALLCAAAAAAAVGAGRVDEFGPGASFVFGDSLVDAGNNNYIPSLSRADMIPNGIDFAASGGWPTGRFTNGRTMVDISGELLGQPNYAPPFLARNTTGRALLNGVNYASGGAGILNGTGRIFVNRIGMDLQIDYFNITRRQLDDLLGKARAKEFLRRKAIFSFTVGSNDFLNNYLMPVFSAATRAAESPDAFIDDLIAHMRAQLTRLYALDARKFVVANVGPLGCIPYQKTINGVAEDECVSLPNQLAVQYNGRLRNLLTELNRGLPGAKFCLANVYDAFMELIANHKSYGFETASVGCCGKGGEYNGIFPCGPATGMCADRTKYVFWDPYHPSEATNLVLARYMVDGGTKYISPINLRKLLAL